MQLKRVISDAKAYIKAHKTGSLVVGFGVFSVLFYLLPYIIFGKDAYVMIFENIDSEMVHTIFFTEHFFDWGGTVPEMMNVRVMALNTFSLFQLPLYAIFGSFGGYIINDFIVRLTAYFGMFLCINLLLRGRYVPISILVSVLFAYLPVFTVYGLTAVGIPILCWALFNIYKKKRLLQSYLLVAFYAISSSFILVACYVVVALAIMCIFFLCTRGKTQKHFYFASLMLIVLVLLGNIKMLALFASNYQSHRQIWGTQFGGFFPERLFTQLGESFQVFFVSRPHIGSFHTFIAIVSLIAVALGGAMWYFKRRNYKSLREYKILLFGVLTNYIVALTYAIGNYFWSISFLSIFNMQGFMMNRVDFLFLTTWYVTFGIALVILFEFARSVKLGNIVAWASVSCIVLSAIVFVNVPRYYYGKNNIYGERYENYFFANYAKLFTGRENKYNPSWRQFFDTDLFDDIAADIGRNKSDYRTICLGVFPDVLSYNRFHTLDGHMQIYSYDYYRRFGRVIYPELSKDESNKLFAWNKWGNQCYVISNELHSIRGLDFVIPKDNNIQIKNFDISLFYLSELSEGKDVYLFSAVEIADPAYAHFYVGYYTHPKSWWGIYLYKVIGA